MATSKTQPTRNQFGVVGDAVEQFRTPLLAALGAGDLATQAVVDVVTRARAQVVPNAGRRGAVLDVEELRRRLDAAELRKLVDVAELRKLVEPEELRKLLDTYTKAAVELYRYLAEHGAGTYEKARTQPQVKRAFEQLDEAVSMAHGRVDEARGFAEDVLSRVSRTTRSAGEQAARGTERAAEATADAASEAGAKVAGETRGATRKAANEADAARGAAGKQGSGAVKPEPRGTATTRTTNGTSRTES